MQESAPAPTTSRRKVLGGAAAAAAAINLPISACAQVAGSDELKIALVGCGGRGTGAAEQALTSGGTRVVAMADAFQHRLEPALSTLQAKFQGRVDVPENRRSIGLDGFKDVISHADVVILATPPGFRPAMFKAAIEAGKHVFMEKPVAVDSPGSRLVMEYAKKADEKNLKVVVGLQRRYQRCYHEALEQVKKGAIGDIIAAQCYWNGGGVWEPTERTEGMSEMNYQVKNWYYYNWLCGDHIVEQHIHNIDVVNWFLDNARPESAQGMGGRELRVDKKYGQIFDHHYVEFRYPNGVICNSQSRHQKNAWSSVTEFIVGSTGTLFLDGHGNKAEIKDRAGKSVWRHRRSDDDVSPYQVEHNELYKAIRENKPLNNAHYGADSTFTSIMGRYATYSGKIVKWDESLAWNNSEMPEALTFDTMPLIKPNAEGHYPTPKPGIYDPSKPFIS